MWRAIAARGKRTMQTPVRRDPDARGYFGPFGGKYVPETLMPALAELEAAYEEAKRSPGAW